MYSCLRIATNRFIMCNWAKNEGECGGIVMHLDILIDMKLLLCSVTSPGIAFLINRKLLLCSAISPRIALAILAKQSADFAFSIYRKLLLCGVTSPRIALAILAKQSAGFAFLVCAPWARSNG